ncbi:MAG: chemotaxis response regulator protein-glutamate methylesterase [Firmicutes bacterium]|nr:chemotaxis response regulator protein-glutamate methylesterase [Bacillota bacterium]
MISKKIKVLVVDDSALIRKILTDILKTDSQIDVVGTAKNGKECIEKTLLLKPDVITLDLEMPLMNGLIVLEELKKTNYFPVVIILSGLSTKGAESTIKALELGAADFVTKPKGMFLKENIDLIKNEILSKIKSLAKSSFIYKPAETDPLQDISSKKSLLYAKSSSIKYFIGIGTSTGGPKALQDLICRLPIDIPAAIFIVQHMPPGFTKSLAKRLDGLSKISVKEAENGEIVKQGYAYIAPGEYHMEIINRNGGYEIKTNQKPLVSGHRPSVNVMMESLADLGSNNIIAVIMTGMGTDGTIGIKKIKEAGGKTIAQNEETSVIYGMPKSAIQAGVIDIVLSLEDIAMQILKYMEA